MENIKIIRDIIMNFMNLDDKHCYFYNNKWTMPNDKGLFVVIGIAGSQVIANTLRYKDGDEYTAINECQVQDQVEVNIFSYDTSARVRRHEIYMALVSDFAQKMQEKYGFRIGINPTSINDASMLEASKNLNRYTITFNVIYQVTKEQNVGYFDDIEGYKTIINN